MIGIKFNIKKMGAIPFGCNTKWTIKLHNFTKENHGCQFSDTAALLDTFGWIWYTYTSKENVFVYQ